MRGSTVMFVVTVGSPVRLQRVMEFLWIHISCKLRVVASLLELDGFAPRRELWQEMFFPFAEEWWRVLSSHKGRIEPKEGTGTALFVVGPCAVFILYIFVMQWGHRVHFRHVLYTKNNQHDDTCGLSYIFRGSRHSLYMFREREGYSKRLHSMPGADCTEKNELLMMSFLKARNM